MPTLVSLSSATAATDPAQSTLERGEAHLRWFFDTLLDPAKFRMAKADLRRDVGAYARSARESLRPTMFMGSLVLARTLGAIAMPTAVAWQLYALGYPVLAFALTLVVGASIFGVSSLVHDAAHGSLFPAKRLNRVVGHLLAPLMLLDFRSFVASHMGHHKHSQSYTYDPKNPRMPRPAQDGEPITLEGPSPGLLGLPLRAWYAVARQVLALPPVARHLFYAASLFALGLPVVLVFAGEVSLRNRDWRSLSPWLSLAGTVGLVTALSLVSPFLGVFYVASLWVAMGFFFGVFLTHITPFQVYPEEENPAVQLMSLNISDIRSGRMVELLGNAFTEYHAAHHLLPFVPSYRLAQAGAWLDATYGDRRAPTFDLTATSDFVLIGDAIVNSLTRKAGAGLVKVDTPVGRMLRMELMEGAVRSDILADEAPAADRLAA